MKIQATYRGTTSSGKMHKYEVMFPTMAAIMEADGTTVKLSAADATLAEKNRILSALTADYVEMNKNLGGSIFLSPTHLHTIPMAGNQTEVDVKGLRDDDERTVNWFDGIDKDAQRAYAKRQIINRQVGEIVMVETALTANNTTIDVEKFERIQLLKAQQAKVNKEMQAIILGD